MTIHSGKNFFIFPNVRKLLEFLETSGIALEFTPNTPENAPRDVSSISDDYSRALTSARIAAYDNFRSAPRITEIKPNTTNEFIEELASTTYNQAQQAGGTIPYTVIREVTENFIHAQFREIIVSIYDKGNTIRFSDQGPGISQKEKAQMPGFSSATEPMKRYIRGVGSGFPLVKEYLSFSHGRITIEDNLKSGAVITISVQSEDQIRAAETPRRSIPLPPLNERERHILQLIGQHQSVRVTDIAKELDIAPSSTHRALANLEEYGLIETVGKLRQITEIGQQVIEQIS